MFEQTAVRDYLFVNAFDGIVWLNKEQFESMMYWTFAASVYELIADTSLTPKKKTTAIAASHKVVQDALKLAQNAHYQVDVLLGDAPMTVEADQ